MPKSTTRRPAPAGQKPSRFVVTAWDAERGRWWTVDPWAPGASAAAVRKAMANRYPDLAPHEIRVEKVKRNGAPDRPGRMSAGAKRNGAFPPAPRTISDAEAARIRDAGQAYEAARKAFDPKKYARGGGYTPAEERRIEEMAGVAQPSNQERGALELYDFVKSPPDRYFLYVREAKEPGGMHVATTWVGDVLGRVVFGREYKSPSLGHSPSARVPITVYGVNGVKYHGTYFKSSGDYARVRRSKK